MHQRALFARGYLLTTQEIDADERFPFFGNWTRTKIGSWYLFNHCDTKQYLHSAKGIDLLLIGHAYNPFTSGMDEEALLQAASAALDRSEERPSSVAPERTGSLGVGGLRGG